MFPEVKFLDHTFICIPAQVVYVLETSGFSPSLLNINFSFLAISRYYILPGHRPFGWIPPKKEYQYEVPLSLMIRGFIYVPGQAHSSPRRFMIDLQTLPTVDGQFDDCDVSISKFILLFWYLHMNILFINKSI